MPRNCTNRGIHICVGPLDSSAYAGVLLCSGVKMSGELTAQKERRSLIDLLPKVVSDGKKEVEKILRRQESDNKMLLQTNEYVLPSKDKSGLFRGEVKKLTSNEWLNRLVYGDNLFVMQALLSGDEATGLPSMRGGIDLIYIDPPFDSKADYRTKITLPGCDIEQKPAVIEGNIIQCSAVPLRLYRPISEVERQARHKVVAEIYGIES